MRLANGTAFGLATSIWTHDLARGHRVAVSVISPAPPMVYYWAEADLALSIAESVNDGVADMMAENSERLRGMATVPIGMS